MFEDPEFQDSLSLGLNDNYGDQNSPFHDSRKAPVSPDYNCETPEIRVIIKEEEEGWTVSDISESFSCHSDREKGMSDSGAAEDTSADTCLHHCPECGKENSISCGVKRHQRSHAVEKTCECSECGKCYHHADRLKSHQSKCPGESGGPREKQFSRTLSGQNCSAKEAVEKHTLTHSAEKPYLCCACGKGFSHLGDMTVHQCKNTAEKPSSLSCSDNMKAHERAHAGEQQQCIGHGKGFSESVSVKADLPSHLECHALDQGYSGERSMSFQGEAEQLHKGQTRRTAPAQPDSGEPKPLVSHGRKTASAKLQDQALHLTVRLQQGERDDEEQEEENGSLINSEGEAVDWDARGSLDRSSDNTGGPQTAYTCNKGGGVLSEPQVQSQNRRESSSPTLMMEVVSVGEDEEREGGEEKERERVKMTTVSPSYHAGKRRGRKKKVPEVTVVLVDLPEGEKEAPAKPGKKRGRKKISATPGSSSGYSEGEPTSESASLDTIKRRTRKKRVFPTAVSSEELNLKTLRPILAKRPYRKRKVTNTSAKGAGDTAAASPVPGKRRYRKRKATIPSAEGQKDSSAASSTSAKRRPGRKTVRVPIEIPPELLKKPKEKIDYRCSVCGKEFPHAYKLERHELTHTGEKPYCCSICGRGFNQKGNLKTHYKVHTGRKGIEDWANEGPAASGPPEYFDSPPGESRTGSSLRCLECGKDCESLSALQAHHVTTHSQTAADTNTDAHSASQLQFCRRCGIQFSDKEQLEEHMKTHVKEKPYSCPDCGKRFINESYIQVHQRIHTGEKPYLCSQCGKGYHTASSLKLHEMQHSGDRPFACSLCGKRFRINSYLTAHYQTHIKDRPFLCSVCGKGYARAEELKVHHRLHTGERPYECRECGKSFIYRQGLRQHQRTHGGRRMGPTRQLGRPKQQPRLEN